MLEKESLDISKMPRTQARKPKTPKPVVMQMSSVVYSMNGKTVALATKREFDGQGHQIAFDGKGQLYNSKTQRKSTTHLTDPKTTERFLIKAEQFMKKTPDRTRKIK